MDSGKLRSREESQHFRPQNIRLIFTDFLFKDVYRPSLYLFEYPGNVLTYDAEGKELDPAEEEQASHKGGITRDIVPVEKFLADDNQSIQEGDNGNCPSNVGPDSEGNR